MTPAEGPLRAVVTAILGDLRDGLPLAVRGVLDQALARRGVSAGQDAWGYFTPLLQPVVLLPAWVGGDATSPVTRMAIRAAMAGYLCARTEDDVADHGADPLTHLPLVMALFAYHASALARVAGDAPAFWPLYDQRWVRHADAMLVERHARGRASTACEYDALLARSRPLLLPAAALLHAAGRWDQLPLLQDLTDATTRAAQMLDDLADSEADVAAGQPTLVSARLSGDAGGDVRHGFITGTSDRIVGEVVALLESTVGTGERLGLAGYTDWVREQAREVRALHHAILLRLLSDRLAESKD